MNKDKYLGLKRMAATVASIGLWLISMNFSYQGFKFESTTVLWFGVVMAIVITIVELVFNTNITKLNPTLLMAGIICYIYGVYTNITGFYVLQHGNLSAFLEGTNWIIPCFAGIVCEVLPEALFAWGIGAADDGDLVGNITEMFSDKKPPQNKNNKPPYQKYPPYNPNLHNVNNGNKKRSQYTKPTDEILSKLPVILKNTD